MKTLIIIPAYNEEKCIKYAVESITALNDCNIDYVVINDCSKDNTLQILKENHFNYINLPQNLGIGGAVQTGYKYAIQNNYDIAIQFDGDGQHNPNTIRKMIDEIENGNNLVVASRFIDDNDGFKSTKTRRIGIKFLSKLIQLCTNKKIADPTSGFRACDSKVIKLFCKDYPTDYPEPDTIVKIIKKGYCVKEIPTVMNERMGGKSSIDAFKSIYYMIKVSLAILISNISGKEK